MTGSDLWASFANALSADGRARLMRERREKVFVKGATLLEKGRPIAGAYVVLAGRLRVYSLAPNGRETTLYPIDPGETCVLAINSLFRDLVYPAWVQADSDGVVGILPGPLYRALFASEAAIQDLTVRALSTAVFRLMAELERRHARRLDQRVASLLAMRAGVDGVVRLTQQDLADHIGGSREAASRAVATLARLGLITSGRSAITVRDPAGLTAYAEQDRPGPRSGPKEK